MVFLFYICSVINQQLNVMKEFRITYTIKGDEEDTANVRVFGTDAENAKANAKREYWDIADIIVCSEIK